MFEMNETFIDEDEIYFTEDNLFDEVDFDDDNRNYRDELDYEEYE